MIGMVVAQSPGFRVGVDPGTTTLFLPAGGGPPRVLGDATPEAGAVEVLARFHRSQLVMQAISTAALATLAGLSIWAIFKENGALGNGMTPRRRR